VYEKYRHPDSGNALQLLPELDALYKIAAQSTFSIGLQTLKLLHQVLDAKCVGHLNGNS
jgi:hypothetical protein